MKNDGESFAKSVNAKFLYFSGKTGEQKELIDFITELLKEYLIKENLINEQDEEINNEGIILTEKNENNKKKKGNCAK